LIFKKRSKLKTFADSEKCRELREQLISQDRMKLALELAKKCNIETGPVWFNWGLKQLKLGQYDEAKEKCKNVMRSNNLIVNGDIIAEDDLESIEQTRSKVKQIITILEKEITGYNNKRN